MKQLLPFVMLVAITALASKCKETDCCAPYGTLEITFKPLYTGRPLVMNQVYDYSGKKIRFTRLSFFVAKIKALANSTGTTDDASYLVDFTNLDDSVKATKGVTLSAKLGGGEFRQIDFGIGVNATDNAKAPKDFASSNALSDPIHYWDSWGSYIFTKLEGSIDTDGDGRFERAFTIHTGGNEVYTTVSFAKTLSLTDGSTTKTGFSVELNNLLSGIDLLTVNSTHQTGDLPTMKKFVANFQSALTVLP